MEEARLLRWESMTDLGYKSVASQASLVWLHALRKQLLFPEFSQYMEDVPPSLEKCHVPEKYQVSLKDPGYMQSVPSALRQTEEKLARLQQSSSFGIVWSRDIKM